MKKDIIVTRSITTLEGKPHIETISEQELVHCKECRYAFYREGLVLEGHVFCTKPGTERGQAVKPDDWFCADGEKQW